MPTLAQVIVMTLIKYGPQAVDAVVAMWHKKEDPTDSEIAALKVTVNKPGEDYFK